MRSHAPFSLHVPIPGNSARSRTRLRRLLLAVGLTGLACGSAPAVGSAASHVTVRARADAEVQARAPHHRLGAKRAMRIGKSPTRLGLLRFTVPRLRGAVKDAKLQIHVTNRSTDGPAVYATAANWSESHVSWKNRPALTGAALAGKRSGRRGWIEYDVTPAVAAGGAVSFALVPTSKKRLTVSARESSHAPRLQIATGAAHGSPPSGGAGGKPPAQPAPPSGAAFSDDFNGPAGAAPDSSKWTDYGPGCGSVGDWGSIQCGSTEHLDGAGHLVVPATPSAGAGLSTQGKFGFVYGTMSAWIKMPPETGYWPAFWALNGTQQGQELTGEIDTTEVYTTWPGSTSTGHAWTGGSSLWDGQNFVGGKDVDLSAGFHKYSATVAPGSITYYLDDVEVGSITKDSAPGAWPWGPDVTRPNFLILDLAVGGAGQAAPSAPAEMLVDRVEVTP
jgi:Glycosyl hydrolases family 16